MREDKEWVDKECPSRLSNVVCNVTVLFEGLPDIIKNHINKRKVCNLVNFSATPVSFTKNMLLHWDFKPSLAYVMGEKHLQHFTVSVVGRISAPFLF